MAHDQAYLEAEDKIEQARRSGATELDLSGNIHSRLTDLPESLSQLTQLQSLTLIGNRLDPLPEWLGFFTQLQVSSQKLGVE